ncbi:MAG: DUF5107 domain-containing protein [Armatimonadetes bacterium]|nr:DUF5107 domain-containing protein [Armatimonadota bacterium]
MSELRLEEYRTLAANLGGENPLPPLQAPSTAQGQPKVDDNVPEEARRYLGWGTQAGVLPYRMQDQYDRDRQMRGLRAAVLENEVLRATFLLDLGGRLWSLLHKPSGRELLYCNPVFQPGSLAVRNAWFAGGVEWNVSIQGHTPFTCSPLFAARTSLDDGTPVLRLYEWERIRQVPYQMDFWLPDGSEWLFARMRISNPHPNEIPMYWWSNIAVWERPDVRVIAPVDGAYNFGYAGKFSRVAIPRGPGFDATYPTNAPGACDYFYDIPDGQRPWEAALDGEGRGLIQASTSRQRGRKLFVWGMGVGGRRWQEFLADKGCTYIEIQAGVARTQYECFPMAPESEVQWLEAYGLMEASPERVHSEDYADAWHAVQEHLDVRLPQERLEAMLVETDSASRRAPEAILHRGSGWGALERRRRERAGQKPFALPSLPFDDASLGEEQAPWLALLEQGALPTRAPAAEPGAWMVQAEWRAMLDASIQAGDSNHWLAWLHLGVMRYQAGDQEGARQAWEQSLQLERSPWALRNLAVQAAHEKRPGDAADLWLEAYQMVPTSVPLAIECCRGLTEAGRPQEVLALLESMPAEVRRHGRIRILEAQAALDADDLARVEAILMGDIEVPDVREGEVSLSNTWYAMHEKRIAAAEGVPIDDDLRQRVRRECPPPAHLDFRMAG